MARLESRLSEHLRTSLIARQINAYFGMAITGGDVMLMEDGDIEEMLTWISTHG